MFERPRHFWGCLCFRRLLPSAAMVMLLTLPALTPGKTRGEELPVTRPSAVEPSSEPMGVLGTATYYAKRFHGRRTASGATYRHEEPTAAHGNLPFGSQVRVVNPANGREVIVTINDRCRFRNKPFIDLSRSAAARIGLLGKGGSQVRIIPLGANAESLTELIKAPKPTPKAKKTKKSKKGKKTDVTGKKSGNPKETKSTAT